MAHPRHEVALHTGALLFPISIWISMASAKSWQLRQYSMPHLEHIHDTLYIHINHVYTTYINDNTQYIDILQQYSFQNPSLSILIRTTWSNLWNAPSSLLCRSKHNTAASGQSEHGISCQSQMIWCTTYNVLFYGILGYLPMIVDKSTRPPPIVARNLMLTPSKFLGTAWIVIG